MEKSGRIDVARSIMISKGLIGKDTEGRELWGGDKIYVGLRIPTISEKNPQ